ncbi:MAG TPA: acyl-CoA dehydrogenase [candidate division Zixibacteria bacterium]|nr:acyl-CoA dehydrogenase [candidate division Zixibacteria bacterium]HER00353.1 acyl-CoA dehydrogenase [candidate division Zixibacteria bacterium]
MNFDLSEDHIMMRDFGREFAAKRLFDIAEEMDAKEYMPDEVIEEAKELGFFGLLAPEEYGGEGIDTLSYALIIEELSKACAGFAIMISVHNSLVMKAIEYFGTDEQKKEYLPKLASGEIIGAYSLSEPGSGTDAGSLKCQAIAEGDHYVFNGTKSWVTSAQRAGIIIVFALTDPEKGPKGISAIIVPAGTEGMSLGAPEKKMGLKCSDTREVSFIDAKVPKANLIGEENHGFKVALSLLDNGRIGVAAQALGIAESAFREAFNYSKERKQFGRPISEFQAIQFKLADMATQIDAAKLLVYRAAVLNDAEGLHSREISMAKLFATEMSNYVVDEAVQIHGGYGYVKEYPVERYFRDARVTEIYEGTSEAQRIVISRNLLKG